MGRYQLHLLLLTGMGWAADNAWMTAIPMVLPDELPDILDLGGHRHLLLQRQPPATTAFLPTHS